MVNQKFYQLGTAPSVIRELFAYGLEQAQVVGPENVFDYSLGNPSIPAPAKVNQSIHDILNDTDSIRVHGYSMACGFDAARPAIRETVAYAHHSRILKMKNRFGYLRQQFQEFEFLQYNKIQGLPFTVTELRDEFARLLKS